MHRLLLFPILLLAACGFMDDSPTEDGLPRSCSQILRVDTTSRQRLEFLQDTLSSDFMDSAHFVLSNRQWIWKDSVYNPDLWLQELGCIHQQDTAKETIRCGYLVGGFWNSDSSEDTVTYYFMRQRSQFWALDSMPYGQLNYYYALDSLNQVDSVYVFMSLESDIKGAQFNYVVDRSGEFPIWYSYSSINWQKLFSRYEFISNDSLIITDCIVHN